DQWGGTFENRTRLIRNILKDIKAVVPASFMVGVRLSPEDLFTYKGIDFDEALETAALLALDGADFIHVSPWDTFKKPEKYPDSDKSIVTYFREKLPVNVPLITAGNIWSASDAQQVLDMGADIIALGKAGIGVPDWPTRARDAGFDPQRPPYSVQHLRDADLSEAFIQYMRRWKDFVE
ncbi:MAG: tRNA-dihydrouridine synthase, partial [Saprospiraceae bacterium]|nr:tRNA-dihydrouridine synthase [Saprospiraceae bacterium]